MEGQLARLARERLEPPAPPAPDAGAAPAVPPVVAPLLVSGAAAVGGGGAIEPQPSAAPPAQLQQEGHLQRATASCRVTPQQQGQQQQQQTQQPEQQQLQLLQLQGQQVQQQRTQQHQQRPNKVSRDPRLPNGGAAAARRLAAGTQQGTPAGEPGPSAARQQAVPSPGVPVPQPTAAQPQGSALTPLPAPEQGPPRKLSQQQAAACGSAAAPPDPRPCTHGGHEARQPAAQPPKQAVSNRNLASNTPAGTDAGAMQPAPLQRRQSATRQQVDGSAMRTAGQPEKRTRPAWGRPVLPLWLQIEINKGSLAAPETPGAANGGRAVRS